MEPLSRILVPVDLSPVSEKLVDLAGRVALKYGSEVLLLYIIDEHVVLHAASGYDVSRLISGLEERAREKLEGYLKTLRSLGVASRLYDEIPVGDPGSVIPHVAYNANASEIFITNKGSRIERILPYGSTFKLVVKTSPVPVLRIRVSKDGGIKLLAGENMFKHILVCVDENTTKDSAQYIVRLATKTSARLSIIHVLERDRNVVPPKIKNLINLIEGEATAAGLKAESYVMTGEPYRIIEDIDKQLDPTLIYMGRTVRRSLSEIILGATLDRIISVSPKPILIYPLTSPQY